MPSVAVPAEVWDRIFHYVAPPLPYVDTERASFAVKPRREQDESLDWETVSNLMLVSKRINDWQELVTSVHWSYLSIVRPKRLASLHPYRGRIDALLENVKVLELGSLVRTDGVNTSAEEAQDQELAVASLIRRLPNLIHIHFQTAGPGPTPLARIIALTTRAVLYSPLDYPPLQGLTGLILDVHNFDAAMLLLSLVAPSLRRLCISSTEESFIYGTKTLLDSRTIEFPSLGELLLGESNGADCSQLCVTLAKRWRLPVLHKVSLQSDPAPEIPPGNLGQWRANLEDGLPFSVVSYPGLEDVQRDFANIAAANITELAFAFQHWPAMDIIDFKATLDAVPEGRSQWVKVVVIFEGSGIRQPQGERDRCLIELVNRRRLPSLEKVVWLSPYGDPEEEHLDDEASWSGILVKWSHRLQKEGILFELD